MYNLPKTSQISYIFIFITIHFNKNTSQKYIIQTTAVILPVPWPHPIIFREVLRIFNNLAFHSTMDLKQIFPIESGSDSYIFNYAQLDHFFERCITWHWHSFFELNYIMEGEIELRTTNSVYTLKEGDISFVNSGVIHHVSAKDKMKGCKLCLFFFDIHFLSGDVQHSIEVKYILPVLKNKKLQAYTIRPNTYERVCMIQNFLKMLKLDEQELFGYEFELRTELSCFLCLSLANRICVIQIRNPAVLTPSV